jgi:Xaa-Pro aminopeptidase
MTVTQGTDRTDRLVSLLPDAEVDAMLVTALVNVRYLTGYTGSNGLAVVAPHTRAFVTDFRYVEQAAEQVDKSFDRHRASQELIEGIEEVLPGGPLRLGFELANLTVRDHRRLRQTLPDRVELVGVDGLVERLRAIKEPEEVERIREAAKVADVAFQELIDGGLVGRTEREVAFELGARMYRHGASQPSFETIVAGGPHGALPHATPRDVEVQSGQFVVIDWGAQLDGYCSDCTRTVATGEPGAAAADVYGVVLDAQKVGVAAVKAGADARAVDSAAREVIVAGGYGERFGSSLVSTCQTGSGSGSRTSSW